MSYSRLESVLLNVTGILPEAEHTIDTVRSVLLGELGTSAQRNSIIRIIKAVTPKNDVAKKLTRALGSTPEVACSRYPMVNNPGFQAILTGETAVNGVNDDAAEFDGDGDDNEI